MSQYCNILESTVPVSSSVAWVRTHVLFALSIFHPRLAFPLFSRSQPVQHPRPTRTAMRSIVFVRQSTSHTHTSTCRNTCGHEVSLHHSTPLPHPCLSPPPTHTPLVTPSVPPPLFPSSISSSLGHGLSSILSAHLPHRMGRTRHLMATIHGLRLGSTTQKIHRGVFMERTRNGKRWDTMVGGNAVRSSPMPRTSMYTRVAKDATNECCAPILRMGRLLVSSIHSSSAPTKVHARLSSWSSLHVLIPNKHVFFPMCTQARLFPRLYYKQQRKHLRRDPIDLPRLGLGTYHRGIVVAQRNAWVRSTALASIQDIHRPSTCRLILVSVRSGSVVVRVRIDWKTHTDVTGPRQCRPRSGAEA